MSDRSTLLSLPYIMPAQAQKHLTHNDALRLLDALVQLAVASATQATPPAAPEPGQRHILPAGAQSAWAGQAAGTLAVYDETGWSFVAPQAGWVAWVVDKSALWVCDGIGWGPAQADPVLQNLPQVGIGTMADVTNRLAVAAPATLLTHAGSGHQIKVNKASPGDTASLLFQTGWSGRAEMGIAGSDDFRIKVSADGATFHDALAIDRGTGRLDLAAPMLLAAQDALPAPPATGRLALYARDRAGQTMLEMQRPSGQTQTLQPHLGFNRVATWAPASGMVVTSSGMPRSGSGTVSTPTLTPDRRATAMRRWRMTSAAAAGSATQDYAQNWVCWRGNAAGLGGFGYVNRLSLTTLQATGMGFFGLLGSTAALPAGHMLVNLTQAIGIGFQRGTHANWQVVHNDGSGTPTLIDLGSDFAIAVTGQVLTLHIAAAAHGADIGLRVVDDTSGALAEIALTTDLPAPTQMLAPRNFLSNGSTAAAVAYDCAGVYIDSDG